MGLLQACYMILGKSLIWDLGKQVFPHLFQVICLSVDPQVGMIKAPEIKVFGKLGVTESRGLQQEVRGDLSCPARCHAEARILFREASSGRAFQTAQWNEDDLGCFYSLNGQLASDTVTFPLCIRD